MKALLFQHALKLLGDFGVRAWQDAVQKFDDGHLGTEPAPDRAKFETDHARANNEKFSGNLFQRQRAGRGDDRLLVDCDAGKLDDIGACRDDDIFRFEPLGRTILRLYLDAPGALIVPCPIKASILFFLKRKPTPLTLAATVSSLCFIIAERSSSGLPVITPKPARSCRASANFSDAWSSAFEGMQPMLRQVPPCVLRFRQPQP